MSFASDVQRFTVKAITNSRTVFVNTASHAHQSIQVGSPVTGAPGQPVDQGNLRASVILDFKDANTAEITIGAPYAQSNEDGIARPGGGPYVQRSPVGGRHSIKLTIAGLPRIIEYETKRVTG